MPDLICEHFPANEDGHSHFTYFDVETQLSFVWCGWLRHPIQVCAGGYGEPVVDTFLLAPRRGNVRNHSALPTFWLEVFRRECERYLTLYKTRQINEVLSDLEEQFEEE